MYKNARIEFINQVEEQIELINEAKKNDIEE